MIDAVLPPLVLLALTSSPPAREVYLPADYEELKQAREAREAIRTQSLERQQRWYSERAFHLLLRAGARIGINLLDNTDETATLIDDGSLEVAIGFSKRLAQRYALQANVSVGTGFGRSGDERVGLLFDSSADVTLRIGSKRIYFGIGPLARFWRVFGEAETFRLGGGAVGELGFLLGDNREIDIAMRVQAGGFRNRDKPDFWLAETLAIGWHF